MTTLYPRGTARPLMLLALLLPLLLPRPLLAATGDELRRQVEMLGEAGGLSASHPVANSAALVQLYGDNQYRPLWFEVYCDMTTDGGGYAYLKVMGADSKAPAAEMATKIRCGLLGSRRMVCRHMPPAPGVQ